MEFNRILLKLSGEALAGEAHHGFSEQEVMRVAKEVKKIVDKGIQVCIVIGGGNFWRGRSSEGMDRVKADQIGMLATVMNCIYAADAFRREGMKCRVTSPYAIGDVTWKQARLYSSLAEQDILTSQQIWLQYLEQ